MTDTRVDQSQIFLVYMALIGDVEKTAAALDLDPKLVRSLAIKEQWADKVARVSLLSKSGTPGDWERAQNRALNFVQCHQMRRTIDGVIAWLSSQKPEDVIVRLDDKGQKTISARLLGDLSAAMERIHAMTYNALGDSIKERDARKENQGDGIGATGIHAAMISTLNQSKNQPSTAATLADAASETVEQLKSANPPA